MIAITQDNMKDMQDLNEIMHAVENAYKMIRQGKVLMPERLRIVQDDDVFLYMPCFIEKYYCTKMLSLFPDNPKAGLPYIDGALMLHERKTGKPIAVMDAKYLTMLRTGAAGGVGMKYLSRPDASSVGIVGAGNQGMFQALYACSARNIREVYLFDTVKKDLSGFIETLRSVLGEKRPEIKVCESVAELVSKSHIVVTTTMSQTSVLPDNPELLKGKCIIGIGSYRPDMHELPESLWGLVDEVYIELDHAKEETGDLATPLGKGALDDAKFRYIGDLLLNGEKKPVYEEGKTTCFKSVGTAAQDLMAAIYFYEKAMEQGAGLEIDM